MNYKKKNESAIHLKSTSDEETADKGLLVSILYKNVISDLVTDYSV